MEDERLEEFHGTKKKRHVKAGYDLLDEEIAAYERRVAEGGSTAEAPTVLIAPSWQEDNILDSCFDGMVDGLLGRGWRVIVRPHPEYTKRYRSRWEALQARYENVPESELYFEKDFSSNETIWTSDILITDWSSVSCEFVFSTLKPCIFVDTPMKEGNTYWRQIGIEPTDISLRNQVGVSFAPEHAGDIGQAVADMLASSGEWRNKIEIVREGFIFNLGHGAEVSGEYLLQAILDKQESSGEAKSDV